MGLHIYSVFFTRFWSVSTSARVLTVPGRGSDHGETTHCTGKLSAMSVGNVRCLQKYDHTLILYTLRNII